MFSPAIVKREISLKKLNLKQDLFCKLFATDSTVLGNASKAYMMAYDNENFLTARTGANKLLDKPEITARIQHYLSEEGFNNEAVDKKHNFLIHQNKDLNVSLKSIQEYNKLKKRIDNTMQIIMPKPIMDWDDEVDTIRKIDKSKAKDV